VGRQGHLNNWGCQKELQEGRRLTSTLPTPALATSILLGCGLPLVFTCGGSLELQSKPTVRDSSIFDRFRTDDAWLVNLGLVRISFEEFFLEIFSFCLTPAALRSLGTLLVTGFWFLQLISKWRLSFLHRKSPIRLFDPSWLAFNPWPLVFRRKESPVRQPILLSPS